MTDSTDRLAFIFNTEEGHLEGQSLLLAESIRTFAGALRDTPLYSYQPRAGLRISSATAAAFRKLGVEHRDVILNEKYRDYAIANKILVMAHAEETIDAEILVFFDSDQAVLQEPTRLRLAPEAWVGLRPVDFKNIGSDGESDEEKAYWDELARFFGIRSFRRVRTTVDDREILGYWNSGLVAGRRDAGVFSAWFRNFEAAMQAGLTPPSGIFHTDQACLAATIHAMEAPIETLPEGYNYPIHLLEDLPAGRRVQSLEEPVTIHYHKVLSRVDMVDYFARNGVDLATPKGQWLTAKAFEHRDRPIGRSRRLYRAVRRRLAKLARHVQK